MKVVNTLIKNDKTYSLVVVKFIAACLQQKTFQEAFLITQSWLGSLNSEKFLAENEWTHQFAKIFTSVLTLQKELPSDVDAGETWVKAVFALYKEHQHAEKIFILTATLLSLRSKIDWSFPLLDAQFEPRYQFLQAALKQLDGKETLINARQRVISHQRFYHQQRLEEGKKRLNQYLADQLKLSIECQMALEKAALETSQVISTQEKTLEEALKAGKDAISYHYQDVKNQNIVAYREYEAAIESAKREAKKKKKRHIFRAIAGIVVGAFFAPILAPKIFMDATGLGLLMAEGFVFGAISSFISKQNILNGASTSAIFAGFSHVISSAVSEYIKQCQALRESLKIAAMASLQQILQGGKFVDNMVSFIGSSIGLSIGERLRVQPSSLKQAVLQGITVNGALALRSGHGSLLENTLVSVGMGGAKVLGQNLSQLYQDHQLKKSFIDATESYKAMQHQALSQPVKTRQIADPASPMQADKMVIFLKPISDKQQQRRNRFSTLATFSDALQQQNVGDNMLTAVGFFPAGKFLQMGARGVVLTHRLVVAKRAANEAFKGGKYAGQLETFRTQGYRQLKKTVRSYGTQIKNHEKWLKKPGLKYDNWKETLKSEKVAVKYHWRKDILRLATYKEMAKRVHQEKMVEIGVKNAK